MIPRVVLVLLLALAAVTAYCARQGGDTPPAPGEPAATEDGPGLHENPDNETDNVTAVLHNEDSLQLCGDLCCAPPARYDQLLLQYLVESFPGSPDVDPPDLADSQPRWVRIPALPVIATTTPPPNLDEHSSLRTNYEGRRGATRRRLLEDAGGNVESERAVWRGLAWLARQQRADGSWQFDAGEHPDRVGATALALLAFLGAGETHLRGTHKAVVAAGIEYIMDKRPRPQVWPLRLSSDPFAHALGTIALCEAVGMTQDRAWLLAAAQSAVNHIVVTQSPNGSWAAAPGQRGDITLVGWQVQALKAAAMSKAVTVPAATFKKAVDFLNLAGVGPRKQMYGPFGKAWAFPGTTWTASGLLCRYLIDGWGPDQTGMMQGVGGLMPRVPVPAPKRIDDVYFLYHATQLVRYCEGDEWVTWNLGPKVVGIRTGGVRDLLVGVQRKDGDDAGSFDPDDAWVGTHLGRLGTTAFAVLTLEVYYRHMPLYKRAIPGALSNLDGK